ncbi:MAG: tRNA pseudouridine(38-40) synthase TruA, partial [Treponemataceae bacterium]|nr:tRNA pseudouridine(38-40) synthase TruA [Treponemataceae bacterium]
GRLNEMAGVLRGEMDCASFAAAGDASRSTFRYLEGACFFERPSFPDGSPLLVFEIEANAFLWKMVRTIVGTLLDLDRQGRGADAFREVIERRDRAAAGATAPPNGLFLHQVRFDGVRRHV